MRYQELKRILAWAKAQGFNVAQLRHKDLKMLKELYEEYSSKLK